MPVFKSFRGPIRPGPAALIVASSDQFQTITNGPCTTVSGPDELITNFSTQATSDANGELLGLEAVTIRDVKRQDISNTVTLSRGDTTLLQAVSRVSKDGHSEVITHYGSEFRKLNDVTVRSYSGTVEVAIDGRVLAPTTLTSKDPAAVATTIADLKFADQGSLPDLSLSPELAADLQQIAYKAMRELSSCSQSLMNPLILPEEPFAGCQRCLDDCDTKRNRCFLYCQGLCGSIPWCVAACDGEICLGDYSDCLNSCNLPPGPCCPKQCVDGGFASCCQVSDRCCGATCCPTTICCGSRCCSDTEYCGDPSFGTCCPHASGPPCGPICCQPGQKCADRLRGFCCAENLGAYCPDAFGRDSCCPPGQVCADPKNGVCCSANSGPLCGEICCQPGQVCDHLHQCCDPRLLCGPPDRAACCFGVCHNGNCCSTPNHLCGDVCCPPFNVCCTVAGKTACCGVDEVCLPTGCCPRERACGNRCCPPHSRCADPTKAVCVACPSEEVACLPQELSGLPGSSICCPPGVNCCAGKCCGPHQMCCKPLDDRPFGCYDSVACIH